MQNAISYLQDLSIYLQWSGFICAFVNLNVSVYCDMWWLLWRNNPVLDIRYFYVCPSILFSLVTGLIQWWVIDGYLVHRLSFVAQCWEMWPVTHIPVVLNLQLCSLDNQRALTSTINITPCHIIITSYASLTLRNSCTTL
jgi:hypothetical protein